MNNQIMLANLPNKSGIAKMNEFTSWTIATLSNSCCHGIICSLFSRLSLKKRREKTLVKNWKILWRIFCICPFRYFLATRSEDPTKRHLYRFVFVAAAVVVLLCFVLGFLLLFVFLVYFICKEPFYCLQHFGDSTTMPSTCF